MTMREGDLRDSESYRTTQTEKKRIRGQHEQHARLAHATEIRDREHGEDR
jgi:hypothetical protein